MDGSNSSAVVLLFITIASIKYDTNSDGIILFWILITKAFISGMLSLQDPLH